MRSITTSIGSSLALVAVRSWPILASIGLAVLLYSQSTFAQLPDKLPWLGSVVNGRNAIVQPGIAAVSCGTTIEAVKPVERFTFGLMNIHDVVPDTDRDEPPVQMYHHSSWHVDKIGNVFGVAINERTGDIFVSASSNYAAGFFGKTSVLKYGSIGGGANDLFAAGTVYQIDAVTGEASVFAVLPQQFDTITHTACEGGGSMERRTGVGLGNIHYDHFHDQYFVTNIEDGRIYRLGPGGDIRDSYDPGAYDDNDPGISSLSDLVYGVAVEPGGGRLFFGGVSTTNTVPLWSIDLSATGGFVGTPFETEHFNGASWSNYVGVETPHATLATEAFGAQYITFQTWSSHPILGF